MKNYFCPDFLVMQKNGFIGKIRLTSKFVTSQTGQQISKIHILPSVSRSKGKRAMKFGQLIKYNVRNVFLLKSFRK